ncbi:GNAT family N-acetyltransferase [Curtobacterium sp. 9128]|uniref:GNAT family N-acetyltransferase n=1 Tax=Curtobacterium sp. 9128 TaxID=1793722 RepID=UPI0011A577B6|nr:GNAT family N-acetyltransferase [Curtobacterium sp. 9128]
MTTPTPLTITTADERHRPQLEQLWTMFRHEMSAFTGTLPDERGHFRRERLDAGLAEPGWSAHLFHLGPHPVGLAVLRGLDTDEHVISSFFITHGARRAQIGRAAVTELTAAHPGRWAVAYQDRNEVAANFWRTVATELDPTCTFEHQSVPGQPELPADSWARFRVRQPIG